MVAVPRIVREVPGKEVHRPAEGLPVIARLRWVSGEVEDVPAIAVAWSHGVPRDRAAVEIRWQMDGVGPLRADWIPASDVRRTVAEPPPDLHRPPTTRGMARTRR